jgi:hypothetical protein
MARKHRGRSHSRVTDLRPTLCCLNNPELGCNGLLHRVDMANDTDRSSALSQSVERVVPVKASPDVPVGGVKNAHNDVTLLRATATGGGCLADCATPMERFGARATPERTITWNDKGERSPTSLEKVPGRRDGAARVRPTDHRSSAPTCNFLGIHVRPRSGMRIANGNVD